MKRADYKWNVGNVEFCKSSFHLVADQNLRQTLVEINEAFDQLVSKNMHNLRKSNLCSFDSFLGE